MINGVTFTPDATPTAVNEVCDTTCGANDGAASIATKINLG